MAHRLVDFATIAKAHFYFCGMHIHIHPRRVHVQVERIDRLTLSMQHVLVGAARCVGEHFVSHKAAIHIAKLLVGARAGGIGYADPAPHPHAACTAAAGVVRAGCAAPIDGNRLRQKITAQYIGQAPVQGDALRSAHCVCCICFNRCRSIT